MQRQLRKPLVSLFLTKVFKQLEMASVSQPMALVIADCFMQQQQKSLTKHIEAALRDVWERAASIVG